MHSLDQLMKARIGTQRIEPGIHPDGGHSIRTVTICLLKPGKRLLLLPECGIETGYVEFAEVALLCLLFNVVEHGAGFVLPAGESVCSGDLSPIGRILRRFQSAVGGGNGQLWLAKFGIGDRHYAIVLPRAGTGLNCFPVTSCQKQEPSLAAMN